MRGLPCPPCTEWPAGAGAPRAESRPPFYNPRPLAPEGGSVSDLKGAMECLAELGVIAWSMASWSSGIPLGMGGSDRSEGMARVPTTWVVGTLTVRKAGACVGTGHYPNSATL